LIYWFGAKYFLEQPAFSVILTLIAAGLVVRAFMLQHDCAHGSFFSSQSANNKIGFLLGILTLTPHACWRRNHLMHHAGTGNLDKRGVGDVRTLTTAEFASASSWVRFIYRVYRHPIVLFGVGAFSFFLIWQRLTHFIPTKWIAERLSVHLTNVGILVVVVCVCLFHQTPFLFLAFHVTVMFIATAIGVWFFYVQHQFPKAYWVDSDRWSSANAAMDGASFYDLHPVLHWFTANIGYHHIHHLDTKIPNYRLRKCHVEQQSLSAPVRFKLLESLGFAQLKLWDCDRQEMVGFK
jgi:acyl-lipid omega-6 desaturase (Delta-12 desaturase)